MSAAKSAGVMQGVQSADTGCYNFSYETFGKPGGKSLVCRRRQCPLSLSLTACGSKWPVPPAQFGGGSQSRRHHSRTGDTPQTKSRKLKGTSNDVQLHGRQRGLVSAACRPRYSRSRLALPRQAHTRQGSPQGHGRRVPGSQRTPRRQSTSAGRPCRPAGETADVEQSGGHR